MSRPGPEADSCAAANFSSCFMIGRRVPGVGAQPPSLVAISGNRNERIDDPTSQLSSAYCKASRSVDCAFGSAICRTNPLGRQNQLFPVYRARTGLRAIWVNNPLPFLFPVPHKTRPGLRLDCVSGLEYDLLPHTPELYRRPLIDYLYYEIITFTTVGYGDVIPSTAQGKLLAICTALLGGHARCDVCGASPSRFSTTPTCQKSGVIERSPQPLPPSAGYPMIWSICIAAALLMSAQGLGRAKTKSDLVVMPSGRQIFAFFPSPDDRRARNSGCGYTA
jgi:Ion channel